MVGAFFEGGAAGIELKEEEVEEKEDAEAERREEEEEEEEAVVPIDSKELEGVDKALVNCPKGSFLGGLETTLMGSVTIEMYRLDSTKIRTLNRHLL